MAQAPEAMQISATVNTLTDDSCAVIADFDDANFLRTTLAVSNVLRCFFEVAVNCVDAASYAEEEMDEEHGQIHSNKSKSSCYAANQA
ncbi:hypothetical protein JR316_0002178 [Psilocybe cubensis]|uniref:Uncharacterized protein n=1 Tax=Psilocybe cubensis TaxID=181762 RepID=A0ACB8HBG8_PSICU|nr:hypothetical protein JR316_0002178 [Psilocybe cubensis]KAH9485271.1 hypothetical protein JR316_0002178 [Psilocybe cubensis]